MIWLCVEAERKVWKSTNCFFVFMIMLSLFFNYIFYMAWNNKKPSIPNMSGDVLQFFHIDSCLFRDRDIRVTGWAFLPGKQKILNRIYAEKKNGQLVELMSSLQIRRDVGQAFKVDKMYDQSGFIATRHNIFKNNDFTNSVVIVSFDENGGGHAVKYRCQ